MRPIVLDNIEEKAIGDFVQLKPGPYTCIITSVQDDPKKEYLIVLLDIAAGEHNGYFSDSFYADKDFAHRLFFSYKDSNLGMFKHNMHVITDCNPGFDAEAAIAAGNEQMLVGKAVGCVFRAEEYYDKKTDAFKLGSPRPDRLIRPADFEDEKNRNPKPRMMSDERKIDALDRAGFADPDAHLEELNGGNAPVPVKAAPANDYSDVPFM